MPAYDSARFNPPAPVATVSLRNLANGKTVIDVPMLIDSGADITMLPQAHVDKLAVEPDPGVSYELMGFDGTTSIAQAVQLDLVF